MLAGDLCDPLDAELVTARERARDLCLALNGTREWQRAERRRTLQDLFGAGATLSGCSRLHPLDHELRRKQEFGKPIEIGSDVWVGGGALILAGILYFVPPLPTEHLFADRLAGC